MLSYLKKAQKSGVILLLAFRQPRSMVLKFIQNVILIGSQANIIYNGPISRVDSYFSQFGLTTRHGNSDSDYLLDIVNFPMDRDSLGESSRRYSNGENDLCVPK